MYKAFIYGFATFKKHYNKNNRDQPWGSSESFYFPRTLPGTKN